MGVAADRLVLGGCRRDVSGGPRATASVLHGDVEGTARWIFSTERRERASEIQYCEGSRRRQQATRKPHVLPLDRLARVLVEGDTQRTPHVCYNRGHARLRVLVTRFYLRNTVQYFLFLV